MPNIENRVREGRSDASETPRTGVRGFWDRLVGPTATSTEQALTAAFAVLATGVVCGYAIASDIGWSWFQFAVVGVITLDVAGGIPANATSSGYRWWHRPEKSNWDHLLFVAVHVHPFVLAALFAGVTWGEAMVIYGYLLVAAATVLRVDVSVRRASSLALFALWLLVTSSIQILPIGLEWFTPLLYLKLLVSHLVGGER
ncbi:hypothetical protein [Natrialba sp. PRR66]|uniref:hypothetical protein n=1 Tax=Natrialba sp. PRR66 TaxID=3098146 RepID=UPI002B1DE029|nr:hypothetical protein [Natrialba sp. PRR66]